MFYSFYRGIQSDISTRFHPLKLYCSELEPPENGPAKVEVQHRATLSQLRQNVFFSYRVSGILEPVQKYRDTFISTYAIFVLNNIGIMGIKI